MDDIKEFIANYFESIYDLLIVENNIELEYENNLINFTVAQKPFVETTDTDRGVIEYHYPGVYCKGYVYLNDETNEYEIELESSPIVYDEYDLQEEYESLFFKT